MPLDPRESAIEPAHELARLRDAYARIGAVMALERDVARSVAHGVSGWSAEEHVAHVALANELSLRNVMNLVAREGVLIRHDGAPIPEGVRVLQAGVIPRGAARAPRMVTPPRVIDRALLEGWLRDNRRDLDRVAELAPELAVAPGRIRHQLLGPLDALQWLRFAAVHTGHHLAIVAEVLAGLEAERGQMGGAPRER
jgi:hypothetical protein